MGRISNLFNERRDLWSATAACLLGVAVLRVLPSPESAGTGPSNLLETRPAKLVALGYLAAASDLYWIRSLQDDETTPVAPGTHAPAFPLLDRATDLDPANLDPYIKGAPALSVVRSDHEGALRILQKAQEFIRTELPRRPYLLEGAGWSSRWMLSMFLGYLYLFEKDDIVSASQAFDAAASMEGAPPYLPRLARRLKEKRGQYDVGVSLLRFLSTATSDPVAKRRYLERLQSLQIGSFLHDLNEAFEHYLRERKPGRADEAALRRFLQDKGLPVTDPQGGSLSMEGGKIVSSTPREKVLGLD